MAENKTIAVSPETKALYKRRHEQCEEADTLKEFMRMVAEEDLDATWDEVEIEEAEERVERTRANIVAILEAVDEFDLTEDILDIVETLSQQDMLAKNQDIIDHLLAKSESGEPLNEVDRLLARVVIETEQERDVEQSPAAEIAAGLFADGDSTTATRQERTGYGLSADTTSDDTEPLATTGETITGADGDIFTGTETAEDETAETTNTE